MDTPDSTMLKRCYKCGELKPREAFCQDKSRNDGLQARCKACEREYRQSHRQHKREYDIVYYQEKAEQILAQKREYQQKHAERIRIYQHEYRKANSAHLLAYARKHSREYQRANPERTRASSHRYRARKLNAEGVVTAADLAAIRAAQTDKKGRLRCWWCGKPVKGSPHVDHKTALSAGGSNGPENLCFSCPSCNTSKQAKSPAAFAGRLL